MAKRKKISAVEHVGKKSRKRSRKAGHKKTSVKK
jgi:hypothetical protein